MSSPSKRRRTKGKIHPAVWIATISAVAAIIGALIQYYPWQKVEQDPTPSPVFGTGRLVGKVTDREGKPIENLFVSISKGPQTRTDTQGNFTLAQTPTGDQLIVVTTPNKQGELTQHIEIKENQTTSSNIVYDIATSLLGLLSIISPVDGSLLEVRRDGVDHRATIYGRCDGLAQILGQFEIWVIIKSERDSRYWIQRPPALMNPNGTWQANIILGSAEHPTFDGERWEVVAVAANSNSEMSRIVNTPRMALLPPHTSSNIATVQTKIVRQ